MGFDMPENTIFLEDVRIRADAKVLIKDVVADRIEIKLEANETWVIWSMGMSNDNRAVTPRFAWFSDGSSGSAYSNYIFPVQAAAAGGGKVTEVINPNNFPMVIRGNTMLQFFDYTYVALDEITAFILYTPIIRGIDYQPLRKGTI